MAYSCYVRHEGRGLIEVEPTVTIRFDQLTTVTCNRIRRVLQNNYNPYGWSSKPHAILTALQGHYKVFSSLLVPAIMSHPDFDKETFKAKALLLDYKFTVLSYQNPNAYRHGHGNLFYKGDAHSSEQIRRSMEQIEQLKLDTLLPIARSLINHTKLAPIMEALDSRQPYTFAGANMK